MIPDEAVEAAARAIKDAAVSALADPQTDGIYEGRPYWEHVANKALEAAAPHLMAAAWSHGHHDGAVDQMLHMENGGAKTTKNPYTPNPEVGPRCPACRVGLVTHDERDPHCIGYRKPRNV